MPEGVLVVEPEQVEGCTTLGMVRNDSIHTGGIARATADMLNDADRLGADSVVVKETAHADDGAFGGNVSIFGTAYDCGRERRARKARG